MTAAEWSDGAAGPLLRILESAAADDLTWQDSALCAETDPEAFFPEKGQNVKAAKSVCKACEVRGECLEYALANDERFGIWGGTTDRQRRFIKRAREQAAA